MIEVIKCILRYHDDLSRMSVFEQTDHDRQKSYDKAVAIRALLVRIRDEVVKEKDKDKFTAILTDHTEAMSKGVLWNRKLDFEE